MLPNMPNAPGLINLTGGLMPGCIGAGLGRDDIMVSDCIVSDLNMSTWGVSAG